MRFSLSATTALLLQVSTTAEARRSTTSTAAFLDAFEFGRIQRKRNNHHRGLNVHEVTDTSSSTSRHRMASKTSKADAESSSLDDAEAKASKKGGYHLFAKSTNKVTAKAIATAFSTNVGSIFVEPVHTSKSAKATTDWSVSKSSKAFDNRFLTKASKDEEDIDFESIFGSLSFSLASFDFSMPTTSSDVATTTSPTSSPPNPSGGEVDTTESPSVTPRQPQPNKFHEVIFKYLSVCTGVELEMNCLTSKTIEALMTLGYGGDVTRTRARRFLGTSMTQGPTPSNVRVTDVPTQAPQTPAPTVSSETTFFPTSISTAVSTTDQCRPEVNEDDLINILTTSKQECIDSGINTCDATFQNTLTAFLSIFDEANNCWDTLCGDSEDSTTLLFFQILLDQASECAGVTMSVDDCILDHIIEEVFHYGASDESGERVRRSLQESCCAEPTESELNFYATYLLLSAEAACAEKGSVAITSEEWNKATDDLVKLFGATECWGVEPCGDDSEVVSQKVPTPSPTVPDDAISGSSDSLPFAPFLSEDGEVCTLITDDYDAAAVRSLELSFFYQVETTADSLDLGRIERAMIASVCNEAENQRRLEEFETKVIAVDSSPGDSISEDYTCTSSAPGTKCDVIKGAMTILLSGPITSTEETLLLAKIASLFPIALDDTTITYFVTPSPASSSTTDQSQSATSYSPFGITVAATAVVAAALLARGAVTGRRGVHNDSPAHPDTAESKKEDGFKGQDELTCAATAELTCASDDASPKHHVLNEMEREHWRELGITVEGDVDL